MSRLVIASKNPVKCKAALSGFQRMFPGETFEISSIEVTSGVSRQPYTNVETLTGAVNRVLDAQSKLPDADYWIGIEGGVEEMLGELTAFAWVAVLATTIKGTSQWSKSRTGTFILPGAVSELVRQGKELGEADDIVFGQSNSKQKNGAVGLLTGNAIDRTSFYTEAVILALIPYKNPGFYPED